MMLVAALMPPLTILSEVAQDIRVAAGAEPETSTGDGLRFVEPEDMHLLIAQFGNLTTDQAVRLAAALGEASWSPAAVRIHGATVFDDDAHGRSIWADLEGDVATLSEIAGGVTRIAQRLGYRFDRRLFQPRVHVATLTGEDTAAAARAAAVCEALDRFDGTPWVTDHVSLMKKSFHPQGTVLVEAATIPLVHAG